MLTARATLALLRCRRTMLKMQVNIISNAPKPKYRKCTTRAIHVRVGICPENRSIGPRPALPYTSAGARVRQRGEMPPTWLRSHARRPGRGREEEGTRHPVFSAGSALMGEGGHHFPIASPHLMVRDLARPSRWPHKAWSHRDEGVATAESPQKVVVG